MRDSASVHQGYGLQQQPSGPSVPGGCQPAVGAATQQAPSQPTIKSEPRTEQVNDCSCIVSQIVLHDSDWGKSAG